MKDRFQGDVSQSQHVRYQQSTAATVDNKTGTRIFGNDYGVYVASNSSAYLLKL
jgi:hypothetical protein